MTRVHRPSAADLMISVVMPVYNERATVATTIEAVRAVRLQTTIIVVDDGSTMERARSRGVCAPAGCEGALPTQEHGQGGALREGFKRRTGDVVIVQDADWNTTRPNSRS